MPNQFLRNSCPKIAKYESVKSTQISIFGQCHFFTFSNLEHPITKISEEINISPHPRQNENCASFQEGEKKKGKNAHLFQKQKQTNENNTQT